MGNMSNDTYDGIFIDDNRQYILDDLQLAAELGKSLLARIQELEGTLRHHQDIIEDQTHEIEYLTKQNGALREVNDSRMRIYEQLEVSIQDLERDKYKLAVENQAEKKHVKALCRNVEVLEAKVDELVKTCDDVWLQLDAERRKAERLHMQLRPVDDTGSDGETIEVDGNHIGASFSPRYLSSSQQPHQQIDPEENEELIGMIQELEKTRKCYVTEQSRVIELEEQLAAITLENQLLQSKIVPISTMEEMQSVHDELSILEESRRGQVCTPTDFSEAETASSGFSDETSNGTATQTEELPRNSLSAIADKRVTTATIKEEVKFKPSTAGHDLHKLKKLDLSYAEVLRRADQCKHHDQRRHHHK